MTYCRFILGPATLGHYFDLRTTICRSKDFEILCKMMYCLKYDIIEHNTFDICAFREYLKLGSTPVKYIHRILLVTYMFRSRLTPSLGYLHKNTDKIQQTATLFNPLKTKRRLLYLKTQFVPRSKHFSSRL